MLFLNHSEIVMWQDRTRREGGPRHDAANKLHAWQEYVDTVSDGWCYWASAPRAAKALQEIVNGTREATDASVRKALGPIRACCTRHRLTCPF